MPGRRREPPGPKRSPKGRCDAAYRPRPQTPPRPGRYRRPALRTPPLQNMQGQIHPALQVAAGASVRSNRVVGLDPMATSERISGREPPEISEWLRRVGGGGRSVGGRGTTPLDGSLPLSFRRYSRKRAHSLCHWVPVAPENAGPVPRGPRTTRRPRQESHSISIRPRFVCARVAG